MSRLFKALLPGLLLALLPMTAGAGVNQWSGPDPAAPFATGLGNRVIGALAVAPDGKTIYAGTGSGSVFSYTHTPPAVVTGAATAVATTSAMLNGTVNARGVTTTVTFEYGPDTGYGTSVAANESPVSGSTDTAVGISIAGLSCNTLYHFRARGVSGGGTAEGDDQTLTTPPCPEMRVEGNSIEIASGDATPGPGDHTDFGSADIVGGTVVRTFTVKNTGSLALSLTGSPKVGVGGGDAADFTVTLDPASPVVSGGGTTTFQVTFDPGGHGTRSATLSIANDDGDENPYTFSIQGTGIAPEMAVEGNANEITSGDVAPSATDHTDFGAADIATGAAVRTFTIRNGGTDTLNLPGTPAVSLSGADAADFVVRVQPEVSVATAGSTNFQITFDPATTGVKSASVSIANDDPDEDPYTFSIQGTGTAVPEMRVEGSAAEIVNGDATPAAGDNTDFGRTAAAVGTIVRTFVIKNTGSADLSLTGTPKVVIGGADAVDFAVSTQPGTPVAALAGATSFEVTFDPSGVGLRSAIVSIANNDSDENPYSFSIQGVGLAQYTVSFLTDGTPGATLTGSLSQVVTDGSDGTAVTANEPAAYSFVNWSGSGGFTSTDNPLTVTQVTQDMTITANYVIKSYTVDFQTDGTAGATLTGIVSQSVNHGFDGTAVTANEPAGYSFVNWTGSGGFTSTDNPLTVANVTQDLSLTANYAVNLLLVCQQGCTYGTIQAAIDAAGPGDVVQVDAGIYRENLRIDKSLKLRRGTGMAIPSIDGAALPAGSDDWVIVDGDVDGNGAGDGSVVTVEPAAGASIAVRFENLVFTGGLAEAGGGLLVAAAGGSVADIQMINTLVVANDATSGGGIALLADGAGSAVGLTQLNSTVGGNTAGEGGGILAEASAGGSIAIDMTNQIVWGNRSGTGEEIHLVDDGTGAVQGSAAYSHIGGVSLGGSATGTWSDGAAVSAANPLYANPGLLDFRLGEDSPAIDTGDAVTGPTEDFEADARPQGSGIDIGADEHVAADAFTALQLTSLNGGERIAAGEPYQITWGAPAGTSGFRLWYSLNNGTTWVSLTPAPLADVRRLEWRVPRLGANAAKCLVKIAGQLGGQAVRDVSNGPFAVEVVRVLSPNGGEHLVSGDVVPIRWKTFGTTLTVAKAVVQYTRDGGTTWVTLREIVGNPGRYDWTVPAAVAGIARCRVRVVLKSAAGAVTGRDASEGLFNIGKVHLLSPNGGETVASGGTVEIAWKAHADAVSFSLYSSLDGITYLPLSGGQGVTGTSWSGAWPVAAANKKRSFVKIVGYTADGRVVGSDISNVRFTTAVARVTAPNGGEIFTGGTPVSITWETNSTSSPVLKTVVSTSLDGGASWKVVPLDGNPGTWSWTPGVPAAARTQCRVKVELRGAGGVLLGSDVSDRFFTIEPY